MPARTACRSPDQARPHACGAGVAPNLLPFWATRPASGRGQVRGRRERSLCLKIGQKITARAPSNPDGAAHEEWEATMRRLEAWGRIVVIVLLLGLGGLTAAQAQQSTDQPQQPAAAATEPAPPAAAAAGAAAPAAASAATKPDGGGTPWMLPRAALALMMTRPWLALFYGGMVRKKNVLATLMQCFAIWCGVSGLWMVVGYSLAFSAGTG